MIHFERTARTLAGAELQHRLEGPKRWGKAPNSAYDVGSTTPGLHRATVQWESTRKNNLRTLFEQPRINQYP